MASLTPVIIITAFGTIESAIQAMKMGAYDYITKPFQIDEIVLTVKKALENRLLKKEVVRLKRRWRRDITSIISSGRAPRCKRSMISSKGSVTAPTMS